MRAGWKLPPSRSCPSRSCRVHPFRSRAFHIPKIFNLRTDPYERADITSNTYYDWYMEHAFMLVPAQAYVGQFLELSYQAQVKPWWTLQADLHFVTPSGAVQNADGKVRANALLL
jgi:hypothetical protein